MYKEKIVLIGASTGGPGHLRKILRSLPYEIDYALVIVQHMNSDVIKSFASQMQENSSLPVRATNGKCKVEKGNVYICTVSMEFFVDMNEVYLVESRQKDIYSPSVNILFHSAVTLLDIFSVYAVLLTGIGDDGASAMLELYNEGAVCIAESKESAIVYGMPKQAYNLNKNIDVMHLCEVIEYLKNV